MAGLKKALMPATPTAAITSTGKDGAITSPAANGSSTKAARTQVTPTMVVRGAKRSAIAPAVMPMKKAQKYWIAGRAEAAVPTSPIAIHTTASRNTSSLIDCSEMPTQMARRGVTMGAGCFGRVAVIEENSSAGATA